MKKEEILFQIQECLKEYTSTSKHTDNLWIIEMCEKRIKALLMIQDIIKDFCVE